MWPTVKLPPERSFASAMTALHRLGPSPPLATGAAAPSRRVLSHCRLLRHLERVVDLDAQMADGAFDLAAAQEQLDNPQVLGALVDQGCLAGLRRSVCRNTGVPPFPRGIYYGYTARGRDNDGSGDP